MWGNWVVRVRATGTVAGTVQATLPAGGPAAGLAEVACTAGVARHRHRSRGRAECDKQTNRPWSFNFCNGVYDLPHRTDRHGRVNVMPIL